MTDSHDDMTPLRTITVREIMPTREQLEAFLIDRVERGRMAWSALTAIDDDTATAAYIVVPPRDGTDTDDDTDRSTGQ